MTVSLAGRAVDSSMAAGRLSAPPELINESGTERRPRGPSRGRERLKYERRGTGTHLALVDGQGLLLEHEPLGPPKPADDAVLLDRHHAAADDVGAVDHVRVAVGGATDARVRRGVGRAGGGGRTDREGGGVAGAGEHVLDVVAASDRRRGCRTRGRKRRGGDLVVCHGKLVRPRPLARSGWRWIRLHGAQKTGSQEEDAERDASALRGGRTDRMVVQRDGGNREGGRVVRGVRRRAGLRRRRRRRRGRRVEVAGVGASFV